MYLWLIYMPGLSFPDLGNSITNLFFFFPLGFLEIYQVARGDRKKVYLFMWIISGHSGMQSWLVQDNT